MINGTSSNRSYPCHRVAETAAGALGRGPGSYSTASCGFCGPPPHGRTCQTAIRRTKLAIVVFSDWVQSGVLMSIQSILAEALREGGHLDLREALIDGSFAPAKKGGNLIGKTKRGKGTKIMAIADRHGRPVAVYVESATPQEVTLVKTTVAQIFVRKRPTHLVGDSAYESDRLDAELAQRGIELIAPHRRDRKHRTPDGRPLRRYRRRWRSNDYSRGFKTTDGSSYATSVTQRTFLGCCTLLVASSCCAVYEMTS